MATYDTPCRLSSTDAAAFLAVNSTSASVGYMQLNSPVTSVAVAACAVSGVCCRQVAMKRVRELTDLDLDAEASKPNANGIMWAVFAAFLK